MKYLIILFAFFVCCSTNNPVKLAEPERSKELFGKWEYKTVVYQFSKDHYKITYGNRVETGTWYNNEVQIVLVFEDVTYSDKFIDKSKQNQYNKVLYYDFIDKSTIRICVVNISNTDIGGKCNNYEKK